METDKIIYMVYEDGIYSNIEKIKVSENLAYKLLNSECPNHFKTFKEAKNYIKTEMSKQLNYWKDAYKDICKIQDKDIKLNN